MICRNSQGMSSMGTNEPIMDPERIAQLFRDIRKRAEWTQEQAAGLVGRKPAAGTWAAYENPETYRRKGLPDLEVLIRFAAAVNEHPRHAELKLMLDELFVPIRRVMENSGRHEIAAEPKHNPGVSRPEHRTGQANIGPPEPVSFPAKTIPIWGRSVEDEDGTLIFDGDQLAVTQSIPELDGVRNAYAVYVYGTSMENRYYAGEKVYVHPTLPWRVGDFVVVQIKDVQRTHPYGYLKRLVKADAATVVLEQFNPPKKLQFPRNRVLSIHKVIMGG